MITMSLTEMEAVEGGFSWKCGFALGFAVAVVASDPLVGLAFGEQLGMLVVAGCAT
jgi:hypothetical protein